MNSYPKKLYLPVFGGKFIPDGRYVVVRNQVEEIALRDKGYTDLEDAEHKSNTRGFFWFLWMDIKINWDWWFVIIVMVMMMVFSFIVAEAHLLR